MSESSENIVNADAVVAKRIDLVDKDGKTRFTLGSAPNGEAVTASFVDAQGAGRILLAVQDAGNATISLTDANQRERVRVSSGAMGNAITLLDREQRTRLLLQLEPDTDGGEIHLVDETGAPQIVITQIGLDKANPSPLITIRDQDGNYREA